MRWEVRSQKDFYAGLLFASLGASACVGALAYDLGSATRMGPGFFPAAVGGVLFVLGVASILRSLAGERRDQIELRSLWPIVLIILGAFSFSMLIDRAGLIAAVGVMLLLSMLGRVLAKPVEFLSIIVLLTLFSVGLFIYGFGMPIKPF